MSSPTSNPNVSIYTQGAGTASSGQFPSNPVRATVDPSTSNIQGAFGSYPIGQEWINTATGSVFSLVSYSSSNGQVTATWVVLGGGTTALDALAGDTGSATPVAGSITIAGGTGVTTTASGSTVTINVDGDTGVVTTLTGNSGGARSPTTGNINIVGSGALSIAGSGSTLTGSITPGTALLSTITASSGGALSPTSGNINIVGTANQVTTAGSASTVTLTLPSAIIAPGSLQTTTSLTAGNSFTVTTGNVLVSNGDISMATAGNKLHIPAGTNASIGVTDAMNAGNVSVVTSALAANDTIIYCRNVTGGTTGDVAISVQAPGGFTLTSTSGTETSTFNYWIIGH